MNAERYIFAADFDSTVIGRNKVAEAGSVPASAKSFDSSKHMSPVWRELRSVYMLPDEAVQLLITEEQIRQRTRELGQQISQDYQGKDLLLLCVLKGGILFLSDLMRQLTVPHAVDFMAISSYESSTESSGVVRIIKDLDASIEDRNVLIVEDIIDTGHTLDYLTRILRERLPASLRICTLLNKPSRREIDVPVDYIGFDIPNEFVFGYGLDIQELYRNVPYVGILKPEFYPDVV